LTIKFLKTVEILKNEGPRSLAYKAQRKLRKALRRALSYKAVKSEYGVVMSPNWGDATFEYCVLGEYGTVLSDLIRSKAEPFLFIDIGANQGLYSLVAGQNPSCRGALAYEPVGRTFDLLCENIRLNRLGDKVEPFNYGISISDAHIPIFQSREHSGKASLHRRDGNDDIEEIIVIKTARSIEEKLSADLPVLMKIDVEGHEVAVLQSIATAAFASRVSEVFYEVDEEWVDPTVLERILRDMNFRTFEKYGSGSHYDVLASR